MNETADQAPTRTRGGRPSKVCIVKSGWHGDNDPSTATFALAQYLAKRGENVTLLWVPTPGEGEPDPDAVQTLRDWYFKNDLIRLVILDNSHELHSGLHRADKASVAVYHHLRDNDYDIAYVSLEGGLAHFSVTAKMTGVFPRPPTIVLLAYEPLLWRREANQRSIESKEQITISFMERTSVERCDQLVVSCQSLRNWMNEAGWKLPKKSHVLTPLVPLEWQRKVSQSAHMFSKGPIDEIVFIGGTEPRGGLSLFCDSVDALIEKGVRNLTVSFLGAFGKTLGEHSGGMIIRRARTWPFRIRMLPFVQHEKAIDYLQRGKRLLVFTNRTAQCPLPLLACISEAIPFVATDVGGIAELVERKRAKQQLAAPQPFDIASKISALVQNFNHEPTRSDYNRKKQEQRWEDFHVQIAASASKNVGKPTSKKQPLVSIILAHYDRPESLRHAVESVKRQDYPNIELIVVDDGSKNAQSHELLDELELEFKNLGWCIIRQRNSYLGAARNAGVRHARGKRILFLDDDNALFPSAVSTLVRAMKSSGADICTSFAKWLHERTNVPLNSDKGNIWYFPTGGPSDMGLFNNPYGDANALFRRDVFDRIGFLNETRGLSASDWEFFLRADLAGLTVVVVPEALYWYRADPEGMNRNSNWFNDRRQLMNVFRKEAFRGLDLFFELAAYQNVDLQELNTNKWNLGQRVTDPRHVELADMDPNSVEAIDLLSEIAACDGRPDTALELIAHTGGRDFRRNVVDTIEGEFESNQTELSSFLYREAAVPPHAIKLAQISSAANTPILSYVDRSSDRLYIEASEESISTAILRSACPAQTVAVSTWIVLPEAVSNSADFLLLAVPAGQDSYSLLHSATEDSSDGCSGWQNLSSPLEAREIKLEMNAPSAGSLDLVLAVKYAYPSSHEHLDKQPNGRRVLGGFAGPKYRQAIGSGALLRHPRSQAPSRRQRARLLSDEDLQRVQLTTEYASDLPLLLVDPQQGGIFLRPSKQGPVAAALHYSFPAFARRLTARVEIAHEEASPFEFALALSRAEDELVWSHGPPKDALAFSGWHLVSDTFELRELSVSVRDVSATPLSVHLAIRLPKGSSPSPANAFWRSFIVSWD